MKIIRLRMTDGKLYEKGMRCPTCNFRIRGGNHQEGEHHKVHRVPKGTLKKKTKRTWSRHL